MKLARKKIIVLSVVLVLLIGGILIYVNLNRALSDALLKSFNSGVISHVYELKFRNLSVNIFQGSIKVHDVSLLPREKPLRVYPYINSTFKFKTKKLALENVDISSLLTVNELILDKIIIEKPEIDITLRGKRHVLLPFKDTTSVTGEDGKKEGLVLDSFFLEEFRLVDAVFHLTNEHKQREFDVDKFSISLQALTVSQQPGEYKTSLDKVALVFGAISGKGLRQITFKDFRIGIDSLAMEVTMDTVKYNFHDFTSKLSDLHLLTIDSLFSIDIGAFDLSYLSKSIKLKKVGLKANVSHAVIQRRYPYQHTEFTGTVGSLEVKHLNFDSIMYANKLFIDEIVLDSVEATIFKDKTKPLDTAKYPVYFGQTVNQIKLPLRIKSVKATNVNLVNMERKPDTTTAEVNIRNATMEVRNISNLSSAEKLQMIADLSIENAARVKLNLQFDYRRPQFSFEGAIAKFNLPDLNPLLLAYTPAKINKGVVDEISFSGVAERTKATGELKFLYHDLDVDLELYETAKWRNGIIAFAANSVVNSSNPSSADLPPRVVQFNVERDMNKGFINVIMKSILNGLKETMIMSKENKKTHKESVKEAKKNKKKDKKAAKGKETG